MEELYKSNMIQGRERPIIAIYGSYCVGLRGNCKDVLHDIIRLGDNDPRLSDYRKNIVEDLENHIPPPSRHSSNYSTWVTQKTNYYLDNADFNAIFILKDCNNITPVQEAEYVLRNNLQHKSIILFEMEERGDENTVDSLYTLGNWSNIYDDIPVEFIEFEDFESAWNIIMGRLE